MNLPFNTVQPSDADDHYVVISADGHAGADIPDYRPYLEAAWLGDFDAWAAEYANPFDDLKGDEGSRSWDSDRRLADLEADGQVAEVLYPNTIPPFYPIGSLVAQPPAMTALDAERRWAGLRAHNRWLADFCDQAPGRRGGIFQITLHDLDASIQEMRWAKDRGLFGGIVLPGAPPGGDVPQLHDSYYEPLWHACSDLEIVVNHHGGSATPVMGPTGVDRVLFMLESPFYSHRAFSALVLGGVLERHPNLQLVFTEQGTAWIGDELLKLDHMVERLANSRGSRESAWGREVAETLSLKPSQYWARQCHVGSSFIRAHEVADRASAGVDRIMWGSDYPHQEGTGPYSVEALRWCFSSVPEGEVRAMLGGNAATVYGFDVDLLQPLAQIHGPTVAQIAEPLPPGAVDREAERSPAFIGYDFGAA
ncbi:MAG: hypothetical protein NVS4B6_27010 [Mycobacterium sp.]